MSRLARAARVAPAAIVAVALGRAVDARIAAGLLAGAALVVALRRALSPSRAAERWLTLAAVAAGGAFGWVLGGSSLGPFDAWSAALASAALGAATWRAALAEPEHGYGATFATVLTALAACGHRRQGDAPFAIESVLVLAAGVVAGAVGDPARVRWSTSRPRHRAAGVALVLGAAAGAAALAHALPIAHAAAERMIVHALTGHEPARAPTVGFRERIELGGGEIEQSRAIVMRLRGPELDYLRGAVLDEIDESGANAVSPDPEEIPVAAGPAPGAVEVRLEDPRGRYFVPRDGALSTPTGHARREPHGTWLAPRGVDAGVYWVRPGAAATTDAPTRLDVFVTPQLKRTLGLIAEEWTAGRTDDRAKLEAIAQRFARDFRYSLRRGPPSASPVLDFLVTQRVGHCDYFASAGALLARALGIPARVVTGYRVAEENPVGGFWVVRAENAHAWAEVWLDGRWETFDPTPTVELPQNARHRTGRLAAWLDVALLWASALLDAVGARGRVAVAVLALGAAAAWLLRGRVRFARRRARAEQERDAPMPELAALLDALAARGDVRPSWEPIERLADRLADEGDAATAGALRAYAAHRYGGVGERAAVASAIARARADVARSREPRPSPIPQPIPHPSPGEGASPGTAPVCARATDRGHDGDPEGGAEELPVARTGGSTPARSYR